MDTQGYDSVWSNDIKEIRAGYIAADPLGSGKAADSTEADSDVKDLHDRWLYYKTNWLDKAPEDVKDDNRYMVDRYITDFNKQIADTGLVGLHAGLINRGGYSESDRQQYLSGQFCRSTGHAANRRLCGRRCL